MNYLEKLKKTAEDNNSIVCMGLDPVLKMFPLEKQEVKRLYSFLFSIIQRGFKIGITPGAFKLNEGFYSVHDFKKDFPERFIGSETLFEIIKLIKDYQKNAITILDAKYGDIGPSSANYAEKGFERFDVDAMTVNPYMGIDSVNPFTTYCKNGKGVYVLCYTSNSGRADVQELGLNDGRFVYEAIADYIIKLAKDSPGVGAVVGATSSVALERLARKFAEHNIPILIPGVGGQGGSAKDVVDVLRKVGYPLYLARINSSSGITHPWVKAGSPMPENHASIALEELILLNESIGPIF